MAVNSGIAASNSGVLTGFTAPVRRTADTAQPAPEMLPAPVLTRGADDRLLSSVNRLA